jgi:Peptidase A4 family/IPT/TIG domain
MQWNSARRTSTLARRSVGLLLISFLAATGSAAFAANAGAQVAPVSPNATTTLPKIQNGTMQLPALAHPMKWLSPHSQSGPHGHPLEGVGGLNPHAMTNGVQGVTNGPLNLSSNWSGFVGAGSGATFTAVQGDWVVPSVQPSGSDEASATWIGIDGVQAQSLIQTGTDQLSGPDFGGVQYLPWIELLPGAQEVIGNGYGPAPVGPGDLMTASIFENSPGLWTIDLNDTTQNWYFSQAFSYSTPGTTAEWIEEAPIMNGILATLADYGSTTFSNLGVAGTGLSSAQAFPVYMATQSGAIISYPGNLNPATNSFPIFYGSPSPQVTSVSPNQGYTSGGTTVTIGGNFVTGVTSVNFGGELVPFFRTSPTGLLALLPHPILRALSISPSPPPVVLASCLVQISSPTRHHRRQLPTIPWRPNASPTHGPARASPTPVRPSAPTAH